MCVYHYEDSRRADLWIKILLLGCLGFSAAVSIPMFILTYPGDECLLFVSVRGEALIYGNPAGCNFIAYGHGIIGLIAIITLGLLLFRRKKGIIRRKQPKEIDSTRSLRGTQLSGQNGIGLGQSHYNFQSEDRLSHFGISRFYSTKVLVLSAITSTFALVTAMVIMSGYLITCNELHYETRRQVLGKTTLGSPIKSLNIQCWSLFRDTDFHTRFHFDHYEFSGQWHGQYRGYQHGREHQYRNSHEHLIEVALALELSLSSTWFSAALWITVTCLMVILKKRQKQLQARELAESIEDAKIFASSRQLDPSQNIMMQPISDQLSVTSNQSSVLSQKPSIMSGNSVSTQPMGGSAIVQNHNGIPMVVQQQMLSQQEILNQQMLQMQQLQTQMANQQRLHQSQPTLVAGGAQITQHDQRPASQQIIRPIQVPVSQQQQMAQQNQLAQLQQQAQQNQQYQQQAAQQTQLQQQQYMTQQNGVQYVQLYNGVVMPVVTQPQQTQPVIQQQTQQQAPAVVVSPPQHQQKPNGLAHHGSNTVNSPPKSIVSSNKLHDYSSIEEIDGRKNKSKTAQKLQLDLSQDAGLKCSQI